MPKDDPTHPARGGFDIADAGDQRRLRGLADHLLGEGLSAEALVESWRQDETGFEEAFAARLALSRKIVQDLGWRGKLAFVFAMWGERRRLRPRSQETPAGEDSLRTKLDQLDWLFTGTEVDWRLIPVDDGDPEDSASVALECAGAHRLGDRVEVLRLADELPATEGPLASLSSEEGSRKGGAIVLGASRALERGADAVVTTDADNSVHLGQAGLLLRPFAERGVQAVVGDRKHPDSLLVKAEARWGPGIVVLRHMQRMVGRALFGSGLRDTQAAFKLYGARALRGLLVEPSTFGFSFDSDWLLAALAAGEKVERVPFVFIDSFEESASIVQGPMTTWSSLLRGLVAAARARGADHDEEMAAVIDEFGDPATLEKVVQRLPQALAGAPDADLGRRELLSPAELREWLRAL